MLNVLCTRAGLGASRWAVWSSMIALAGGCSLMPAGAELESLRIEQAGVVYEAPAAQSQFVIVDATTADVVARALAVNGELEGAWHDWRAAIARVERAASWPNTNVVVNVSVPLQGGRIVDRTGLRAAFDGMENLAFPTKTKKAGEQALASAREAGERFVTERLNLRRRVLDAWTDYGVAAANVDRLQALAELAELRRTVSDGWVAAGATDERRLGAEISEAEAVDALAAARAVLSADRAMLAAMLATDVASVPRPPRLVGRDAAAGPTDDPRRVLLDALTDANPELASLRQRVEAHARTTELQKLAWIPDINPTAFFTGGQFRMLGAVVVLPTTVFEIRAAIREAEAEEAGRRTELVQRKRDVEGELKSELIRLADAERTRQLYDSRIIPAAASVLDNRRATWSVGGSDLDSVIEAEIVWLDANFAMVEAAARRERAIAAVETLSGVVLDPGTAPASLTPHSETAIAEARTEVQS